MDAHTGSKYLKAHRGIIPSGYHRRGRGYQLRERRQRIASVCTTLGKIPFV